MSTNASSHSAATRAQFQTNILFYGDNLRLLRDHVPSASVDMIYSDPPFSSNRDYFVLFKDRTGQASAAQEEAFTDTWNWDEQSLRWYHELVHGQGNESLSVTVEALRRVLKETPMMAYLVAMTIRLVEMHRALKPAGSLWLHLDPTASHYMKVILDVIFGPHNFRNEIVWQRTTAHGDARRKFGDVNDTILFYSKSEKYTFNRQFVAHDEGYLSRDYRHLDADGRRYRLDNLASPNPRPNLMYEYKGFFPPAMGWRVSRERMEKLDAEGRLQFPAKPGGRILLKRFLDESQGMPVGNVWTDIRPVNVRSSERLGYPTQKPLALLERIIAAGSNPGDVVLDCFCGCGTAVDAAQELGRRWIGMDVTAVAVDIIQARMEQRHPDLAGKIPVVGFPQDLESAQRMFETDPYGFQEWACLRLGAHPRRNKAGGTKGADGGIDGWLSFEDLDGTIHRVVVQVKGGKVQVSQVRDFCHVVTREKATLGFFVCMGDASRLVTKPMQAEALGMGLWTNSGGRDYRRVQILTVADLLAGDAEAHYPPQDKRSTLGYKAKKHVKVSEQLSADDLMSD